MNLGVNRFLRYDLLAQVKGAAGALVVNTVTVSTPAGTTALNRADDSITDQHLIVIDGVFAHGFEGNSTLVTVPMVGKALEARCWGCATGDVPAHLPGKVRRGISASKP